VDTVVLDIDEELAQHLDLLPVIAKLNPHIPIMAVSTPTGTDVEAAIRSAGVFCFLLRPFAPGEVERHLAAALSWRAAQGAEAVSSLHADAAGLVSR
jgi:DNA-binding NtrC family response regulator